MSFEGENRSLVWIHNADDPRVVEAIHSRRCEVCGANKLQMCHNTINPEAGLPGRVIHFARLEG